jgi:hypothetical protein
MGELEGLPGAWLVERALADLERAELTPEALTLSLASTRLARLGVKLPAGVSLPEDRELALYESLGRLGVDDPYARYNALRRELGSFLEALERRRRRG